MLALLLGTSLEILFRSLGHTPSLSDSPEIWAAHRAQVYPRFPGEEVLVIAGASRSHVGLRLEGIEDRLPGYRVVQLAIGGSNSLTVLDDLANDAGFEGMVLVDMQTTNIWIRNPSGLSAEYLSKYHALKSSPISGWESRTAAALQSRLVVRRADLGLLRLVSGAVQGRLFPVPDYNTMDIRRSRWADFTRRNAQAFRERRIDVDRRAFRESRALFAPGLFDRGVEALAESVRAIHQRGGRVALVHFPVDPELTRIYEDAHPREETWDVMAARVRALAIHYQDHPKLGDFAFPDASHLDYRDTPAFTSVLMDILIAEGFFRS